MHYNDVTISAMASQITTITSVYSNVYSDADQSKHQSSASLASVRGIHRLTVNSPHKGPVTRKMFPFDDVIMMIWTVRPDHFWFPTFWNVLKGCKYKSHIMVQLVSALAIYATNPIKVRHASESGLRDHMPNGLMYWILWLMIFSSLHQYGIGANNIEFRHFRLM